MNATALFVELLVVGIGTATWLALFLAAILGYRFDTMILTDNQALVGTFLAVVYVLGIVMDRLIHGFFVATIEPQQPLMAAFEEMYHRYLAIYPALAGEGQGEGVKF